MKSGIKAKIGIIGGSGLYHVEGIKNFEEVKLKTPFGNPSDIITIGTFQNTSARVAFLPRHGRGHRILPSELNSRANIYALKMLGVEQIVSISACGSLKEEIRPGDFIIPDQIFDRTKARQNTFFGNGIVGHIGFAHPFCHKLGKILHEESRKLGITTHLGGTYVCIDGPQFSTKAESEVNRKHGFSIVGMTAIPESKLAREAEICYATVGLVTDYDVWKEGDEVSAGKIVEIINKNVTNVKNLIKNIIPLLEKTEPCECRKALENAVFTRKDAMNKTTMKKLDLLIGKYIK